MAFRWLNTNGALVLTLEPMRLSGSPLARDTEVFYDSRDRCQGGEAKGCWFHLGGPATLSRINRGRPVKRNINWAGLRDRECWVHRICAGLQMSLVRRVLSRIVDQYLALRSSKNCSRAFISWLLPRSISCFTTLIELARFLRRKSRSVPVYFTFVYQPCPIRVLDLVFIDISIANRSGPSAAWSDISFLYRIVI